MPNIMDLRIVQIKTNIAPDTTRSVAIMLTNIGVETPLMNHSLVHFHPSWRGSTQNLHFLSEMCVRVHMH